MDSRFLGILHVRDLCTAFGWPKANIQTRPHITIIFVFMKWLRWSFTMIPKEMAMLSQLPPLEDGTLWLCCLRECRRFSGTFRCDSLHLMFEHIIHESLGRFSLPSLSNYSAFWSVWPDSLLSLLFSLRNGMSFHFKTPLWATFQMALAEACCEGRISFETLRTQKWQLSYKESSKGMRKNQDSTVDF